MIPLINDKEFMTCIKCNETYPATEEYYYKQKYTNNKHGTHYRLSSPCRECRKKDALKNHFENREERNKRRKEYYWSDPEKNKAASKKAKYNNIERFKEKQKEYKNNNKDKIKNYTNKYKKKQFKLKNKQWEACKQYFDYCCAYCGISEKEAKENQGNNLHKEHVDNKGTSDLSNCVPSCKVCNSSKNTYKLNEWYNEDNSEFSEERLKLIEKWLDDDYKQYI